MSAESRRTFLQQTAALGIGVGLSAGSSSRAFAANDKIRVACIGVRGRGNSVMHSFAAEPDCVVSHICDVNEPVRRQRGEEMKQKTGVMPKLVNDFRDLLDDKSIDVFMVATPDHWHALLTIHGCLAGKDVYEIMEVENLNWRSFASSEAIQAGWNSPGTPTFYILDTQGVIRHKWVSGHPGEQ